ncbi:MAG: FAD-binding oxidoreductase [Chloroflexota bacterium]
MTTLPETLRQALTEIVGKDQLITRGERLRRNSQDAYWYSPILKAQLAEKSADLIVQPTTVEQLAATIAACVKARVPITPRGAGTGNYGQSIPIHGGVLISTRNMTRILDLTPDHARVEAGAILLTMERAAREVGAELRFFPSTLPTSTAAGFLAGGSAGAGSIKWGNLWDTGNILSATIVSVEEEPQILTITDSQELQGIIHNCGLSAFVSDVTFALAPAQSWQQYVVAFDTFEDALRCGNDLAFDDGLSTRLVAVHEWPIPSYFGVLVNADACPDGKSILLLHLTLDSEEVTTRVAPFGGTVTWHSPEAGLHKNTIELTNFSWNHTTLWAMKADPTITYLQDAFDPEHVFEQIAQRKAAYGDSVIEHVTYSRAGGQLRPVGLTLVRFESAEHLYGLMDFCESIGIAQFSPHTTFLDDDGRWSGQPVLDAKARWDPFGLLNPGHLRSLEE